MKRFFLLFLLATPTVLSAQDLIVKKDASEIIANVVEIAPDYVSYTKWRNPNGPTYKASISDILYIRYENGEKDIFQGKPEESEKSDVATIPGSSASTKFTPSDKKRFQAYLYFAGLDLTSDGGGTSVDFQIGSRITDYAFIGAETGLHWMLFPYEGYDNYGNLDDLEFDFAIYSTLGVNLKIYAPISKNVMPFVSLSTGSYIGYLVNEDSSISPKLYYNVGLGIDMKKFSIGAGFAKNHNLNCGYFKFGIRFGK